MSRYDLDYLGKMAEELGFVRDTLEKVVRLADILAYFNLNPVLKNSCALKGGTAINLTIFDLPRLSVDIDLDYLINDRRDEMLQQRVRINETIDRYMSLQGYGQSIKPRNPLSLDARVYDYIGTSGNRDHIKLEINYSLRSHICPVEERTMITKHFGGLERIQTLAPIEIFGSKINALLNRAAPRDLYDVGNMIQNGLFEGTERILLRKIIVFYAATSSKVINKTFDTKALDLISVRKIKTDLFPVIKKRVDFDLESTKRLVRSYLSELMLLTDKEKEFLIRFENGVYLPELLFEDQAIVERIRNHPMALWKTKSIKSFSYER